MPFPWSTTNRHRDMKGRASESQRLRRKKNGRRERVVRSFSISKVWRQRIAVYQKKKTRRDTDSEERYDRSRGTQESPEISYGQVGEKRSTGVGPSRVEARTQHAAPENKGRVSTS